MTSQYELLAMEDISTWRAEYTYHHHLLGRLSALQ
jgi:hypothetical protein